MCFIKQFFNSPWIWLEIVPIFIFSVLHIVFGFIRKETNFNTYDLYNSSPFFDFTLDYVCSSNNIFHT